MRRWGFTWLLLLSACQYLVGIDEYSRASGADGGTSLDGACAPACDDATLVQCVDGRVDRVACGLGCSVVGGPHCMSLAPSNGADLRDLEQVTVPLLLVNHLVLDTDTGEMKHPTTGQVFRTATPDGGVDPMTGTYFRRVSEGVSVLAARKIDFDPSLQLMATGSRAMIFLSAEEIFVGGHIYFDATDTAPGPGGGPGAGSTSFAAGGCAPGGSGTGGEGDSGAGEETGGGGGGLGQSGAPGGAGSGAEGNPGGVGGLVGPLCSGPDGHRLVGGSGGGRGGDQLRDRGGAGGAGGGAVQFSSLTRITVSNPRPNDGIIGARGAGGAGTPDPGSPAGGGGGGSGGMVIFEAPTVSIGEYFWVTAGGGAGGSGTMTASGGHGDALTPAMGGRGSGPNQDLGRGGLGGARNSPPTSGAGGVDGGGGGGGGAGVIRINTDQFSIAPTAVVGPEPSVGPMPKK